jgi:hypothetical protein
VPRGCDVVQGVGTHDKSKHSKVCVYELTCALLANTQQRCKPLTHVTKSLTSCLLRVLCWPPLQALEKQAVAAVTDAAAQHKQQCQALREVSSQQHFTCRTFLLMLLLTPKPRAPPSFC